MTPGSSINHRASGEDPDGSVPDDALSPSDGYFNALPPVPRDELIPDPEQENTPAAKEREAREAEEERAQRARRYAARQAAVAAAAAASSSRRPHSPAGSSIVSASSLRSVDTTFGDPDEGTYQRRPRLPTYDDAIAQRPYTGPPSAQASPRDARATGPAPMSFNGPGFPSSNYGTADSRWQPIIPPQQSTNTLSAAQNDENRPLLSGTDDDDGASDRPCGWLERIKRRWPSKGYRRRGFLAKLLWLLLLVCIIVSLSKILASASSHRRLPQPQEPTLPGDDGPGEHPEPPSDEDDLEKARGFCNVKSSFSWYFEYPEIDSIAAIQITSRSAWFRNPFNPRTEIRQRGEIRVVPDLRPAQNGGQRLISTRLDLYASHGELTNLVHWESRVQRRKGLTLFQTPAPLDGKLGSLEDPCLYSIFWIMIPPGMNLTRLETGAELLDVRFSSGLTLGTASDEIIAQSFNGDVIFPNTSAGIAGITSRDIDIGTNAGNIVGTFPLYDRLNLTSGSGNIEASIDLKEVDPYRVKPAKLLVETFSGQITIAERAMYGLWPLLNSDTEFNGSASKDVTAVGAGDGGAGKGLGWVPARDYQTVISSLSGDVSARIVHGSKTKVDATSGNIKLAIAPYGTDRSASSIDVVSSSSNVELRLARSMPDPYARIDKLDTRLKSSTGDLTIEMPSTWTGMVNGRIITGKIKADWPGLERTRSDERGTFPFARFAGHVGDGDSYLEFATINGVVRLLGENSTRAWS